MTLTQEQISRLWKLSAFNADSQVQIDSALDAINTITEVKTENSGNISRSGNNFLSPRADEIIENENISDELLACSPQKVAAHQIVLAGIMHGE